MKTKLGVLISGRGSNMKAIAAACQAGEIPAEVAVVVSNRHDAAGLEWAREQGLAVAVLPHGQYDSREEHDRAVIARLKDHTVEWVCLAGYMRLLSADFIAAFPNRIINIHPSLLPSFRGLHAQAKAVEYGIQVSGCTVHLVDAELDHGPIIVQRAVPVEPADDEDSLAARILVEEHIAYPEAIRRVLIDQWTINGRRLEWAPIRPQYRSSS